MIGRDIDAAAALVAGFRKVTCIDELSAEMREEFDELAGSALLARFPGAVLVWPRPNKCSVYYALAADTSEWRRLCPILKAFAGPTLTSFNGWSEPLLQSIPVEAFLQSTGLDVVARFVPGDKANIRDVTRRSLKRMLRMITDAPTTTHAAVQTTSQLLAQFIEYLNGNDRTGAERILNICQSELRVDALNLSFMRVRLLSHFSDWIGILEMLEFPSLCYTRKPAAVAVTLLEAIYQVYMAPFDSDVAHEQQRLKWNEEVRLLARPLLRLPILQNSSLGALKLYAWEALEIETRNRELEAAILEYRDDIKELAEALDLAGRTGTPVISDSVSASASAEPLAVVQQALVNAEDNNTLSTIVFAITQLEKLDDNQRKELFFSEHFKSLWQNIQFEAGGLTPPIGWITWIHRLSDPEFITSFDVLQRAVKEWPASLLVDSVEIAEFASALGSLPDTIPASERIADALPLLAAWVAEDPVFPRAGMVPIYEVLLYHLVIGARRASTVYDSAALLIRALLSIGVTENQYRALLEDCLELTGIGAGTRSVYWLLDILEETIQNPAPSMESRQRFWYAAHARLVPLRTHLSPGQRIALDSIGVSLGWGALEADATEIPVNAEQLDRLRVGLSEKSIAIYSLTESAARQAAQVLVRIAPNIKVSLSHDTGGTAILKSMAQNADIFVVATASAKHAATGFIQQMRPREKPLLFASGRGFSSIVRAIEDFVLSEPV